MRYTRVNETAQRGRESLDVFGDKLEAECFDGDETIVLRFVGAKNWSKNAASNLVQHAIRAER